MWPPRVRPVLYFPADSFLLAKSPVYRRLPNKIEFQNSIFLNSSFCLSFRTHNNNTIIAQYLLPQSRSIRYGSTVSAKSHEIRRFSLSGVSPSHAPFFAMPRTYEHAATSRGLVSTPKQK